MTHNIFYNIVKTEEEEQQNRSSSMGDFKVYGVDFSRFPRAVLEFLVSGFQKELDEAHAEIERLRQRNAVLETELAIRHVSGQSTPK